MSKCNGSIEPSGGVTAGLAASLPSTGGAFSRIAPAIGTICTHAVQIVIDWQARYRQRRHLAGLSDAMLKDIGLSRADIEPEATKPFWR